MTSAKNTIHQKEKHFKHYLFEFLMLFLAVTLGFFVENFREDRVERSREKQFIISFNEDLKKDVFELDSLIGKRVQRKVWMDSLTFLLNSPNLNNYGSDVYFYARYLPRPYLFISNDATIQQLKNAGNLRLIRKQVVSDTIMAYDRQLHFLDMIKDREDKLIQRIFNSFNILFDSQVFDEMNIYDIEFTKPPGNPQLKNTNKEAIETFCGDIHLLKTVNIGQIGWFRKQRERAMNTLEFLKKEYDIR